ncbi:uncharacterized protein GGS25DRAFT_482870 [Hypoxylon fragiforme]|uniref:uncharacterized protein n=1 Tax=Hypoxylon fragiforme TaxID=63214 RepID=UPI0020C5C741|nr:uncharacterized protein GGS25DRAFT_482870 [Hypoxylon fragiforme]KAI2611477.1 hypothetical protein GGS25DRAFT_482870 [Hypoxylon fragiforme]
MLKLGVLLEVAQFFQVTFTNAVYKGVTGEPKPVSSGSVTHWQSAKNHHQWTFRAFERHEKHVSVPMHSTTRHQMSWKAKPSSHANING